MNNERLHNVRQCFTLSDRVGDGIRLGYGFGGGLSQSYQAAFRGTPRMKTDIEYQIKFVSQCLSLHIAEIASAQRDAIQTAKAELN